MPKKTIGSFRVENLQIMDEKGRVDSKLMPKLSSAEMKKMYEFMVIGRLHGEKAMMLQRQGRMGTYASGKGEEAAHVGSAFATRAEDWVFPAFREDSAYIVRGVPMELLLLYWAGDEKGEVFPGNNFTPAIPVGSQIPHATGVAWAAKMKGKKHASLVYFGDGATSKGDFHESMNFAGVFKIPCVYMCMNNQYAISVKLQRQTASETIAQKAIAYGIEGIRVDGNDIFAVYRAVKEALEKARAGRGPTLIEAFTYRIEHHTTSDDWTRYRTQKEVNAWAKKDPIKRLESFLMKKKILTEGEKKKIWESAKREVERAVKRMEEIPNPKAEDMFDYVLEKKTWNLEEQEKELLQDLKDKGMR
jgi:pyruvate dehydrogenase E1 component alpha subunit